jgi:toxin YoeB
MLKLAWDTVGWEDYLFWQTQDRKTRKKINLLIRDILRNPFSGLGNPEPLKGDLAGAWSRRINDKDRLVYQVTADEVFILTCRYHYKK